LAGSADRPVSGHRPSGPSRAQPRCRQGLKCSSSHGWNLRLRLGSQGPPLVSAAGIDLSSGEDQSRADAPRGEPEPVETFPDRPPVPHVAELFHSVPSRSLRGPVSQGPGPDGGERLPSWRFWSALSRTLLDQCGQRFDLSELNGVMIARQMADSLPRSHVEVAATPDRQPGIELGTSPNG